MDRDKRRPSLRGPAVFGPKQSDAQCHCEPEATQSQSSDGETVLHLHND